MKQKTKDQKRQSGFRYLWMIAVLLLVILANIAAYMIYSKRELNISIDIGTYQMLQEEEIPEVVPEITADGNEKMILEKDKKFRTGDLLAELQEGKNYHIVCETTGAEEGEYEITAVLNDDITEKLSGIWKDKVNIEIINGTLRVKNKYGEWEGNKFKKIDGSYAQSEFIVSKGIRYYLDADGVIASGWQELENGKSYFSQEGTMTTGWQEIDGSMYYFDADGIMQTGWLETDGKKYYLDEDGTMTVGTKKIGIVLYTFAEDGTLTSEESHIDPTKPMLALTFDDGPGEKTMDLLNALEQYDAHATFFMCGTSLSRTDIDIAGILHKMDDIGCDTSDHTMTHPKLDLLTAEQVVQEVQGVSNIIQSYLGHGAVSLRPPYGRGIHTDTVTQNVGLPMIYWSVDTLDWKTKSKEETVKAILEQARDGEIILLHDIHDWSVEAAIEAIPQLMEQGYQLVTVSEMAAARGITLENGVTYFNFRP